MSAFSETDFLTNNYASYRPRYPPSFFERLINYHKGARDLATDIGCGPGEAAFPLTKYFRYVIGVDISEVMIKEANSKRTSQLSQVIEFRVGSEASIPADSNSVDMVTAAECMHWFDHEKFFDEASRVLKSGGTLAFWGYGDPVFIDYPDASLILKRYIYVDPEYLGPYWEYPGTNYLRNNYRDIEIPSELFTDIERVEYEPGVRNEKALVLSKEYIGTKQLRNLIRTWSAYHLWKKMNPHEPDVVDLLFDEISKDLHWTEETVLKVQWNSVYAFATKY